MMEQKQKSEITIKKLKTADEIYNFMAYSALRHGNYYYTYTSSKNADNILKDERIWFTWLGKKSTNDAMDIETYKNKKNCFCSCFSTGTKENLPLWYLYSGIDGQGVRLGFPKAWITNLKEINNVELVEVDENDKRKSIEILEKGEFEVEIRDILYIGNEKEGSNSVQLQHKEVTSEINCDLAGQLYKKCEGFIKGLIWSYEKETRIQISVLKLLDEKKQYRVELPISDILSKIQLRLGPETTEEPGNLLRMEGIKKLEELKIEQSQYKGQIRMGLKERICRECTYNPKI